MITLDDIKPLRAVIRGDECIGCTKCITACPVDAIHGAAKVIHTVDDDKCIGCERCLPPCPVDCIDMISIPLSDAERQQRFVFATRNIKFQHIPLNERKAAISAAIARKKSHSVLRIEK